MHGQRRRVHDPAEADIQRVVRGLARIAAVVHVQLQVVGAGADAGIGKDVVDAATTAVTIVRVVGGDVLGFLEERYEVVPDGHVCLDKGKGWRRSCVVAVAVLLF